MTEARHDIFCKKPVLLVTCIIEGDFVGFVEMFVRSVGKVGS